MGGFWLSFLFFCFIISESLFLSFFYEDHTTSNKKIDSKKNTLSDFLGFLLKFKLAG